MHLKTYAPAQMRELATQIMRELHAAVTDVGRLKDRYGLVEDAGMAHENEGLEAQGSDNKKEKERGPKEQMKAKDGEGRRRNILPRIAVQANWSKEVLLRSRWVISGMTSTSPIPFPLGRGAYPNLLIRLSLL